MYLLCQSVIAVLVTYKVPLCCADFIRLLSLKMVPLILLSLPCHAFMCLMFVYLSPFTCILILYCDMVFCALFSHSFKLYLFLFLPLSLPFLLFFSLSLCPSLSSLLVSQTDRHYKDKMMVLQFHLSPQHIQEIFISE